MKEQKYISYDRGDYKAIVIFTPIITHTDMAQNLKLIGGRYGRLLGAGFTNGKMCYGKSTSLGIGVNEEWDNVLLLEPEEREALKIKQTN